MTDEKDIKLAQAVDWLLDIYNSGVWVKHTDERLSLLMNAGYRMGIYTNKVDNLIKVVKITHINSPDPLFLTKTKKQ